MTKYLITPSLLSAFSWYLKESFTKTETEQRQEFLQTLRREKTPTAETMQKGIDFEDAINFYSQDHHHLSEETCKTACSDVIFDLANIIKGGIWQQSVKKELKIGNSEFLLYGRTDVIKRDTVFDIKFTGKYELGKFQDSSQHLIYLYCSDLPKFSYLVSDGKDCWREDYFNHAGIEDEIKSRVSEFLDYLETDKEARQLYFEKWTANNN